MGKDFYSTAEAASELQITPMRVRQLAKAASLEKIGRDYIIRPGDLEGMRNRNTNSGPKPDSAQRGRPSKATANPISLKPAKVSAGKKAAKKKAK